MTSETKGMLGMLVITVAIIGLGAWWAHWSDNGQITGEVAGDVNLLSRSQEVNNEEVDMPVTLVEFSDFECPACALLHEPLQEVVNTNADKVNFIFRQFPLSSHEFAALAAQASLAAQAQGKMWEYNDILFNNQEALDKDSLIKYADQLGLDVEVFRKALDEGTYTDVVRQDVQDGYELGLQGTPTLYVNGVQYIGPYTVDGLQAAIDEAFEQAR